MKKDLTFNFSAGNVKKWGSGDGRVMPGVKNQKKKF